MDATLFDLIASSHRAEMAAAQLQLDQRRQWQEFGAIARLEQALGTARSRVATATTKFSRAG